MIWCILIVTTSLESNSPKMCFEHRETCRAYIEAMDLGTVAQCNRRADRSKSSD